MIGLWFGKERGNRSSPQPSLSTFIDVEELMHFAVEAQKVPSSRVESDGSFDVAKSRMFGFFGSDRSLLHLAHHPSSISVLARHALALATGFLGKLG